MKLDTKKIARYTYEEIQALIESDLRQEGLLADNETITKPKIDVETEHLVFVEVTERKPLVDQVP